MVDSSEGAEAAMSDTTTVTESSGSPVSGTAAITPMTSNEDGSAEELKSPGPSEACIEEENVVGRASVESEENEDGEPNNTDGESIDTLRKSAKDSSGLMQQIRYLQLKLSEIERKAITSDFHDEAANLEEVEDGDVQKGRRAKDRAPTSRAEKWVNKMERQGHRLRDDPDLQRERHRWGTWQHWEDKLPLLPASSSLMKRRGEYRRGGIGPPNQYDTSESEDWSDDGIRSRDFDYYEQRLRGEFQWEYDRLEDQSRRYRSRQKRKLAREEERVRKEAEEELARHKARKEAEGGEKEDKGASQSVSGSPTLQPQEAEPPKHAVSKLNREEWALFKARMRAKEYEAFAVDVLIGEPVIKYDAYSRLGRPMVKSKEQKSAISTKQQSLAGQAPLPERIRIHSKQLIQILTKIHEPDEDPADEPMVIIRPFRMLIYYDKPLREWREKLVKKFSPAPPLDLNQEPAEVDSNWSSSGKDSTQNAEKTATGGSDTLPESAEEDSAAGDKPAEEDPDDDSTSAVALEHLNCLLEFMDKDISRKTAYLNGDPPCTKIAFSDLWHLFKPGDEVIENHGKQAWRVVSVTSPEHRVIPLWFNYYSQNSTKSEEAPMKIRCVYVDFDGKHLGPVSKVFEIKRFEGERVITQLDIYPLRFFVPKKGSTKKSGDKNGKEEKEEAPWSVLRRQLIDRGKRFVDVAAVKHMYYAGLTLDARDEVESQVVVDFEEAFVADDNDNNKEWRPKVEQLIGAPSEDANEKKPCNADCCMGENIHDDSYVEEKRNEDFIATLMPDTREKLPPVFVFPRTLQDTKTEENGLTEEEFVIMSYRVFGFVLRNRTWAQLDLTYLTDVDSGEKADDTKEEAQGTVPQPPKTAFDRLVLPPGHKKLVESLISQHFREKETSTNQDEQVDIVRGKGKGLILLLHGAPGVGKTTTAEGVAERFKKPLFQITCGDLGSTAREVEEALGRNFALANRWGCILLLDEADVFLAERRREDFNRNGLVAVFLRVLEYYAGILFLTTNRIGDFDEAFSSRIHISLYYPPLSRENTMEVFKLNLNLIKERFKKKGREVKIDEFEIGSYVMKYFDKYEKARWNGRQIRNACQTALALADYDAQNLKPGSVFTPNAEISLRQEHFKIVSDAYLEFMQYLKSVRDTYADEWAKEEGIRALEKDIAALKAEAMADKQKDDSNQGEGRAGSQLQNVKAQSMAAAAAAAKEQNLFLQHQQQQQRQQQQGGFGAQARQPAFGRGFPAGNRNTDQPVGAQNYAQNANSALGLQGHQGLNQFRPEVQGQTWNNQGMMAGALYPSANDQTGLPPQPQSNQNYGYPGGQQMGTGQFGYGDAGASGHLQPGVPGHEELANNL